jgi:flagellin-specific chaperone FliS
MIHVPEKRHRFSLSKGQAELLQDSLILGAEVLDTGIEQPNGSMQFDLSHVELEDLIESLAAAINHAAGKDLEAKLDKIFQHLENVLG